MYVIFAGEERFALNHFGKDTASRPDINLYVVLLPGEHDFWSAVVTSGDVSGHLRVLNTGKAEIADLEVAVFIDQDVARFEVTVNDACGMHVLQTTQNLVKEILHKLFFQGPSLQEAMEVGALEFSDKVNVLER